MSKAPVRTELLAKAFDGRLRLERVTGSQFISARTYIQGKLIRKSTKETTLQAAMVVAKKWYETLIAKKVLGGRIHGKSFADMAEAFLKRQDEVKEVSEGHRRNYRQKWALLKPHFAGVKITEVDSNFLTALRATRAKATTASGRADAKAPRKPIRPATLKQDMVFIGQVLKHARDHEHVLDSLPVMPSFRGELFQIHPNATPFLTFAEYKHVKNIALARKNEPGLNPRTKRQREEVYWYFLLAVGGALRPDEAYSIRWKDVKGVVTLTSGSKALHMVVRGKHGKGGPEDAFGLFHAVPAWPQIQKARPTAKPEDSIFSENHRDSVRELLEAAGLRETDDGRTRNSHSFRPTGISLQLRLGLSTDFYDIAKWARTSPQMIKDFYDQNSRLSSVEKIAGFRVVTKAPAAPPPAPVLDPTVMRYEWENDDESDE